jgi:hypothetical protein
VDDHRIAFARVGEPWLQLRPLRVFSNQNCIRVRISPKY